MTHELSLLTIGEYIHQMRGQNVILDNTLAEFYQVETKTLKRTVRRNISRFPNDFMFELTKVEVKDLRYQFGTSKDGEEKYHRGSHYLPFAFTEAGVAMLSSVLGSERAVQTNIAIIRAFIQLRHHSASPETGKKLDILKGRLDSVESKLDRILKQLPQSLSDQTHVSSELREKNLLVSLNPAVVAIQQTVANYLGLKLQDFNISTRKKSIAFPRQIAMYFVRKQTGLSFKEIGNYFGGKDHSTVLHGCRKVETVATKNPHIEAALQSILLLLEKKSIGAQ